jgi:hypothetical protein
VELLARGLSVRDIEDAFRDETGRLLLSKTAASEIGERLWQDYQDFATRDLSEYDIAYLFVDGIAERIRPGQRRKPVLAAWGFTTAGAKVLLSLNQGLKQAIIVVPERAIGASFNNTPLSKFGFWADWTVLPQWNLCNAPGADDPRVAKSKVEAVRAFLASGDKFLISTHATFRFAVDELGVEAFDDRLIAVDEFHHVSANPDNRLGTHLRAFMARDRAHIVAMTGSYFRGDAEAVLMPEDEARFETVTYTYYEQLNGYDYLKSLDIGYYFYSGRYLDAIHEVLDPTKKTIVHIPNVNARESLGDKIREAFEL